MALTIKEAVRKWGTEYLTICGIANYFPTMNFNSHVFFVNGTDGVGNDGVNTLGQVPDEPFLTIAKALSECTANANDYVFVLDYPSTAPATEVFPLVMDKSRVHLIGVLNGLVPKFKICVPSTQTSDDYAAIKLFTDQSGSPETYGQYCEIANLLIGSKWTSSTRGCIEVNYASWGTHIHNCGFGLALRSKTGGAHGICIGSSQSTTDPVGEMPYSLIENCTFGSLLTANGIYMPSPGIGVNGVAGLVIRNNLFHVNSGDKGINVVRTTLNFREGGIFNNRFIVADAANGEAITLAAGVAGGMIDGNIASGLVKEGSMAYNPYLTTTACSPAWGLNRKGGSELAVRPALA